MKRLGIAFKLLLSIVCILKMSLIVYGQKQPNVQNISVWAPDNVKVDGKATEWGRLQAHNSATNIYYTLSNDDNYLYFIMQTDDQQVINKITSGGVTFVIIKSDKKNEKDAVVLNFPLFDKKTHPTFVLHRRGETPPPPEIASQIADSTMKFNNMRLTRSQKWIGVKGVTGIDSLISIYNDEGVLVAGLFDINKVYTCEMSIALKHLNLNTTNASKFAYHVLINGGSNKFSAPTMHVTGGTNADGAPKTQADLEKMEAQLNRTQQDLSLQQISGDSMF